MRRKVDSHRGRGTRHAAGLRLVGLWLLLLFAAFEIAHPVADLVHTGHHMSHGAQGSAAHGAPTGEDPVRDAHGPFVLDPALPLPLPPFRSWVLALGCRQPEGTTPSVPSPVPIG